MAKAKARTKSSKKPKAKARAAPKKPVRQAEAYGDGARPLISATDVKYLANYAIEVGNKTGTLTSTLGQEIKTYADKGLDAAAFRSAVREKKMGLRDPVRYRAYCDNLAYYRDVLKLDNLRAKDLFKDQAAPKRLRSKKDEAKAPDSDADAPEDGNVEHLDDHREVA